MAISFIEQSICPLCREKILSLEEIYSFPSFTQNVKGPLYIFNDSSVHYNCLYKHDYGNEALQFAELYFVRTKIENRKCVIDNKLITHYDDYLFIDLLTSDSKEELFTFNFTTINKRNISKWMERSRFIKVAKDFRANNKWQDISSFKVFRLLNYYNDRFIISIC